jgi:ATP-dependent DNA helicase RecG
MASKKEVNALVQGDVSCGKSIVAYLLILLLLENGYQGALLAPTVVLASQHYDDAKTFFSKYGYQVDFINGSLKKKERTGLLKRLASGDIDVLVGTQAAVSDDVAFKNLGIAIVDEEQRFGVTCREKIKTKSVKPIFYITMSATPIPRTLATCIYGEGTGIYSIKSMPGGRQSVDTILTDSYKVPDILKSELAAGRQGYVVCALITEDNKNDDAEKEANPIISVEKTLAAYRRALPGYNIEALTGKTKDKECLQIMQDFKEGKINVLVSTTVIEVGVNNPNASVIVIQNAERFGLSTLHQLRGRVRRGSYKPYCILVSDKRDSERLDVLVRTEDGFELSMEDLNLRRSGNLIGTEQSGKNRFVELAIRKSEVFDYAKVLARELRERKEDETFLKFYNRLEQIS